MKIDSFDRVLMAVKDLGAASKLFSDLLGVNFDEGGVDESQKVKYTRSPEGLEFIQSTSPDGPVARFIEQRGEGLYALIFKVSDMGSAIKEMEKKGLRLVANPTTGGLEEAYFHPRNSHGVMIVLCKYEAKHGATIAESQH